MRIDERIVIMIPPSELKVSARRKRAWVKRAVLRTLWGMRDKILKATDEDIFGLFIMPDCIEINLHGELETINENDK